MHVINSKKLGLAMGISGVILYLACVFLMLIAGQDGTTWFFNSILHGLDVTSVSRANVPTGQTIAGIVLTFGLGWIIGLMTGAIYNWKRT